MAKKGPTVHLTDLPPPVSDSEPPPAAAPEPAEPSTTAPNTATPPPEPTARLNFPSGALSRPTGSTAVASARSALPVVAARQPAGWPVYLVASGAAAITALTPLFYVAGYMRGLEPLVEQHFLLAMVAVWAALPAIVVLMAAYMLQQGRRLAAEARYTRELANRILAPTALAAAEAGDVAELLRGQIADVTDAANLARERLSALREAMAEETARLNDSAATAARTAA
ncbi:MAG: polar localization protein TipN, partial [Caulobacteraceae bacterium]|nr:polar localization protein TipN [Caulobacteraceae bacterium]